MQTTRNSLDTNAGPSDWFTGNVYVDTVAAPAASSQVSASSVHFTPGARTAWHGVLEAGIGGVWTLGGRRSSFSSPQPTTKTAEQQERCRAPSRTRTADPLLTIGGAKPGATVSACFLRYWVASVCRGLRWAATALLHNCSTRCCRC